MSAVYFARFGRFVKIGYASSPAQRLAQIARMGSRLHYPPDFDSAAVGELVRVVPGCRMRDERNMQMLFAHHWTGVGEWFHWTPAFRHQLDHIEFVTHAERLIHLRAARKALGIVPGACIKEWNGGRTAHDWLVETRDRMAAAHSLSAAA